jgi:thioredoxin-related protein
MKKFFLLLLFSAPFLVNSASAEPIQLATDLTLDAEISRNENKPIIFFVTADHCPYCEKLRLEYFRFSTDDPRFILRELELDQSRSAIGFNGEKSNHRSLADRYNIKLTPTVAFVGPDGETLNESIVGIVTMDYYNYYFEKSLGESISRLKSKDLASAE